MRFINRKTLALAGAAAALVAVGSAGTSVAANLVGSADIQDGSFATRFIGDQDAGAPEFLALREKEAGHPVEQTGKELRAHFAWKQTDTDYVEGSAAR